MNAWAWIPILAIACGSIGSIVTTWIRARHGYPIENDSGDLIGRDGKLTDSRKIDLIGTENDRLKGQLLRLEERLAVLERIATDEGARLGREIDALR